MLTLAYHLDATAESYFFEYSVKSLTRSGNTAINSRLSFLGTAVAFAANGTDMLSVDSVLLLIKKKILNK